MCDAAVNGMLIVVVLVYSVLMVIRAVELALELQGILGGVRVRVGKNVPTQTPTSI
jgi:hypothetical protein